MASKYCRVVLFSYVSSLEEKVLPGQFSIRLQAALPSDYQAYLISNQLVLQDKEHEKELVDIVKRCGDSATVILVIPDNVETEKSFKDLFEKETIQILDVTVIEPVIYEEVKKVAQGKKAHLTPPKKISCDVKTTLLMPFLNRSKIFSMWVFDNLLVVLAVSFVFMLIKWLMTPPTIREGEKLATAARTAWDNGHYAEAKQKAEEALRKDAENSLAKRIKVATNEVGEPVAWGKCESQKIGETGEFNNNFLRETGKKGPTMVKIPAGHFSMGDIHGDGFSDEQPVHEMQIKEFALSKFEITFAEYDSFCEATLHTQKTFKCLEKPKDNGWGRGRRPVINVSWQQAVAYTKWLSEQTGQTYRLPTEAEWEYAAKACTDTKYGWGNEINSQATCCGSGQTTEVGQFPPNPFGLYDMVGNVSEWTCSEYSDKYDDTKEQHCVASEHVGSGQEMVVRGGSWQEEKPQHVRTTTRKGVSLIETRDFVGFRVVKEE